MRRPRPALLVLLALPLALAPVAAGAAAPSPANPTTTQVTTHDRDDTDGPLDLSEVAHVLRSDRDEVVYKLRTVEPFEVRHLSARKRIIELELDTDGEPGSEANVRVSAPGGRLQAQLISNATREVVAPVEVRVLGRHTVRLSGPRSLLGARRYFWVTTYHYSGDPITRQDTVPDRGWVRVR